MATVIATAMIDDANHAMHRSGSTSAALAFLLIRKRFFPWGWCATGCARPLHPGRHKLFRVVAVVASGLATKNNYLKPAMSPSSPKGSSQMAKSKRGSDENLFSINGASEALGRS